VEKSASSRCAPPLSHDPSRVCVDTPLYYLRCALPCRLLAIHQKKRERNRCGKHGEHVGGRAGGRQLCCRFRRFGENLAIWALYSLQNGSAN
jgi:hypothetical protein